MANPRLSIHPDGQLNTLAKQFDASRMRPKDDTKSSSMFRLSSSTSYYDEVKQGDTDTKNSNIEAAKRFDTLNILANKTAKLLDIDEAIRLVKAATAVAYLLNINKEYNWATATRYSSEIDSTQEKAVEKFILALEQLKTQDTYSHQMVDKLAQDTNQYETTIADLLCMAVNDVIYDRNSLGLTNGGVNSDLTDEQRITNPEIHDLINAKAEAAVLALKISSSMRAISSSLKQAYKNALKHAVFTDTDSTATPYLSKKIVEEAITTFTPTGYLQMRIALFETVKTMVNDFAVPDAYKDYPEFKLEAFITEHKAQYEAALTAKYIELAGVEVVPPDFEAAQNKLDEARKEFFKKFDGYVETIKKSIADLAPTQTTPESDQAETIEAAQKVTLALKNQLGWTINLTTDSADYGAIDEEAEKVEKAEEEESLTVTTRDSESSSSKSQEVEVEALVAQPATQQKYTPKLSRKAHLKAAYNSFLQAMTPAETTSAALTEEKLLDNIGQRATWVQTLKKSDLPLTVEMHKTYDMVTAGIAELEEKGGQDDDLEQGMLDFYKQIQSNYAQLLASNNRLKLLNQWIISLNITENGIKAALFVLAGEIEEKLLPPIPTLTLTPKDEEEILSLSGSGAASRTSSFSSAQGSPSKNHSEAKKTGNQHQKNHPKDTAALKRYLSAAKDVDCVQKLNKNKQQIKAETASAVINIILANKNLGLGNYILCAKLYFYHLLDQKNATFKDGVTASSNELLEIFEQTKAYLKKNVAKSSLHNDLFGLEAESNSKEHVLAPDYTALLETHRTDSARNYQIAVATGNKPCITFFNGWKASHGKQFAKDLLKDKPFQQALDYYHREFNKLSGVVSTTVNDTGTISVVAIPDKITAYINVAGVTQLTESVITLCTQLLFLNMMAELQRHGAEERRPPAQLLEEAKDKVSQAITEKLKTTQGATGNDLTKLNQELLSSSSTSDKKMTDDWKLLLKTGYGTVTKAGMFGRAATSEKGKTFAAAIEKQLARATN